MTKKAQSIGRQLQAAAETGDLRKVEELLILLDVRQEKRELDLALRWAAAGGHLEATRRLIEAGADIDQEVISARLLAHVASRGHLPVVKLLVASGADIHGKVEEMTAYGAAMESGQTEVMKFLKSQGAEWATPTLYFASESGDVKAVRQALRAGANVEVLLGLGDETPLMAAARMGHAEVVRCLLAAGAKVNRKANEMTALFSAVRYGKKPEVFEALMAAGADIRQSAYQITVLMGAAEGGSLPIVQRLVELGADVQARDRSSGKNVMDYARDGKSKAVIEYLRGLGTTAGREAGRALARMLAREYGGKAQEHAGGEGVITTAFLLDTRIGGWKSQFDIGSEGFVVELYGLHFRDAELRQGGCGKVTIKPKPGRAASGSGIEAKASGKVPPGIAARLLKSHAQRLKGLSLNGKASLTFGDGSARFVSVGSDPAAVLARLQELAAFLREVCGSPPQKRQLFAHEWLLKPLRKAAGAGATTAHHHFGGAVHPPQPCPHCGQNLSLIFSMDLGDGTLPRTGLGKLKVPVMWCLACAYWESTFFDLPGGAPRALPGKKRRATKSKAEEFRKLDLRTVALVPGPKNKKVGRKNKLGGEPAWLQNDESPQCPQCTKEMAFLLQIASDAQVTFADMGLLYAFVCPECAVTASLVQSH